MALAGVGFMLIMLLLPTPGTSCAPSFVEPGTSVGIIDGERHRVLEIDGKRCWARVEPETGGAMSWVDSGVIRYEAETGQEHRGR